METLSWRQIAQRERRRRERERRGQHPLPNGEDRHRILRSERNARRNLLRNQNRDQNENRHRRTIDTLDEWRDINPTLLFTDNEPGLLLDRPTVGRYWSVRNSDELKFATVAIFHFVIVCFGNFYVRPYWQNICLIPFYSQNLLWLLGFLRHCQTGIPLEQTLAHAFSLNLSAGFEMFVPIQDDRIRENNIIFQVNPNVSSQLYSSFISQIVKTISTLPDEFLKHVPILYKPFTNEEFHLLQTAPLDVNKFCTVTAIENLRVILRRNILCFACAKGFATEEDSINHVKQAHKSKFCGPIHNETIDIRLERRVHEEVTKIVDERLRAIFNTI